MRRKLFSGGFLFASMINYMERECPNFPVCTRKMPNLWDFMKNLHRNSDTPHGTGFYYTEVDRGFSACSGNLSGNVSYIVCSCFDSVNPELFMAL